MAKALAEKSDDRPNVYALITRVSAALTVAGISKTRQNQQQGYSFRGIDDVYNALAPLLAKHGLVILPRILSRTCVERQTQKGGTLFTVTVEAEFDFVSAHDGSTHTARTYGEAMDSADKATNKAMSAAYKYAAFQTFCIPTEGDNDADATTPPPIERRRRVRIEPPAVSSPPAHPDAHGDEPITLEQRRRLFTIARTMDRQDAELSVWLAATYGVDTTKAITRKDYTAIVAAVERPGPLPLPREPGADDGQ